MPSRKLAFIPAILFLVTQVHAQTNVVDYNVTGYDVAPDLSKYEIDPYPPLKDDQGNQIDAANVRGTRLFGWEGCEPQAANDIKAAYNDFYKLSHLDGLYANFDWKGQAAREFWGSDVSPKAPLNDGTKEEIRQIYDAASSIWSSNWQRPPWSPGWPGRDLWIHVRCSGGDNTGDPENICGDRKNAPVNNPQCPPPPENGEPKEEVRMQAYSDQNDGGWFGGYSRITFCNRFFNDLRSLDEATKYAKRSDELKENLENWDNRARCFFHEITHLAFFVNSGASGKSPNVEDLRITYGTKTKRRTDDTYGPLLSKILRNFRADGWYPGQNADTYAWYSMAMWAQKEIGHYPEDPKSKGVKPIAAPRRADGTSLNDPAGAADASDDAEETELDYQPSEGFTTPNCGSRMSSVEQPLPVLNVSCVDDASAVPADVFGSATNQVYSTFCRGTVNNGNQLEWMADIFGNLTGLSPSQNSRVKRFAHLARADGPEQFTNWQFKLDWVPDKDSFDAGQCYLDCETAFQVFAATPQCSQKGDEKNLMSLSGQIDVGCGMYGYTVKGIAIS